MNNVELLFNEIGNAIEGATKGNMFGWKCYKIGKTPFMFYDKKSNNALIFKLGKNNIDDALSLKGCTMFNPSEGNKIMKNWAVVPMDHADLYEGFVNKAVQYVTNSQEN